MCSGRAYLIATYMTFEEMRPPMTEKHANRVIDDPNIDERDPA